MPNVTTNSSNSSQNTRPPVSQNPTRAERQHWELNSPKDNSLFVLQICIISDCGPRSTLPSTGSCTAYDFRLAAVDYTKANSAGISRVRTSPLDGLLALFGPRTGVHKGTPSLEPQFAETSDPRSHNLEGSVGRCWMAHH
jgi:hypothetical protein